MVSRMKTAGSYLVENRIAGTDRTHCFLCFGWRGRMLFGFWVPEWFARWWSK